MNDRQPDTRHSTALSKDQTDVDVAIVGGGIAGLWLLNRLSQLGYSTVLLEKNALGTGQTLASQGIIHGGLKYALNGVLSPASSAIADMPQRWRRCLTGEGEIDLRATRLLSEHFYMWSGGSMRSRFKTFLGSKALRGRIDALEPDALPVFLRPEVTGGPVDGRVYQLTDFVVDTPSLLNNLAAPWRDRIFGCNDVSIDSITAEGCEVNLGSRHGALTCRRLILCAGEGNEALLATGSQVSQPPAMQRRPLHMTAVRLSSPAPAYLHCIGDSFGMTPRLTVTCHPTQQADEWIWYLGGEIAETGVHRSPAEQFAAARQMLSSLFPWLSVPPAPAPPAPVTPASASPTGTHTPAELSRWHSFFINRAEPRVADLKRPDTAYVEQRDAMLVCWPTKLTLCPDLGDVVLSRLAGQLNTDRRDLAVYQKTLERLAGSLPYAKIGTAPWESLC